MRRIKDKEGVIFKLISDPNVSQNDRDKCSVLFVKSFIEEKLSLNNVFPENNKVGFHGDIEQISYFISCIIENYISQNSTELKVYKPIKIKKLSKRNLQ